MSHSPNQRDEPAGQQGLPQLRDALGTPRRYTMPTGTPNSNGQPAHSQAEDKPSSLIWDGSRFLPRLVKTDTVPGKGLCYFYDDGSYCMTKIDGEDVNPNWGVTKAGKPRKRLAVACITCREKKIKCDPDYPKCQQCVKYDRVCMFKNAARAAQIMKETHASCDSGDGAVGAVAQPLQAQLSGQQTETQSDAHSISDDSSTGMEPAVSKKRKPTLKFDTQESFADSYNQLLMEGALGQPAKRRRTASPAAVLQMLSGALGSSNCWGEFDWEADPYETYPELVDHLMDLYFQHINTSVYCMFPQKPFRKWLRSEEKSPDDRMLIYTMLALATRFSTDPDRKALAKSLQATAQYAIEHRHGKFSLQLVQSRLLFSLYCFASNNLNEAYEYCGAGIRAALAMKLNIDNGASDFPEDDTFEYGLNCHAIAECRRRTFWSVYLMDRFNGFSSGCAGLISNDDVFVRLPCHDKLFEAQGEASNPFLDTTTADNTDVAQSGQEHVGLGPMAFLVKISFIWGDTLAEIYRSANRPNEACAAAYEAFYSKTQRRLSRWLTDLPPDLVCTEENMSSSSKSGYLGAFLTMHSLHHATAMKLSRYARLHLLSRERVMENIQHLDKHAREQLQMVICFRHRLQLEEPLGIPFAAYATSCACDILSAKIPRDRYSDILELLSRGSSALESLQNHWHTCKKHSALMLRRIERLEKTEAGHPASREGGANSHSPITLECIHQPMEAPFCAVDDIAYHVDSDIYLEAVMNQPHARNGRNEAGGAPACREASPPRTESGSGDEKELGGKS
ncbi:hypothetical protein GP486_007525 [Trichoglossum hirsutum]|uniref:Zn(2)-C6 fungal-type domain-containing protein n=1 Tax=Trichoglossum hirsutum TaxID=265104 RepID=A0A9P8L4T6_9PEZI|nr:hypothetical protein GP486_007525 [Trichoglossum hirsutum]